VEYFAAPHTSNEHNEDYSDNGDHGTTALPVVWQYRVGLRLQQRDNSDDLNGGVLTALDVVTFAEDAKEFFHTIKPQDFAKNPGVCKQLKQLMSTAMQRGSCVEFALKLLGETEGAGIGSRKYAIFGTRMTRYGQRSM